MSGSDGKGAEGNGQRERSSNSPFTLHPSPFSPLSPAGLLFDLDGVLVDSFKSWHLLFSDLFRERYHRGLTPSEFRNRFWARDLRDIFAELDLDLDIDSFCLENFSRYLEHLIPAAEARSTLERLGRYPKAIITNTPGPCAWRIIEKMDLHRHFGVVITGGEVTRGKPDPEMVHKACHQLAIRPEEAVLIGDSPFDVQAGKAAGCLVVGIGVRADHTIERLPELLDLLRA